MAFYQRASKLVLTPVASAASTSILLGSTGRKYTSQTTKKNMNKLIHWDLNAIKFRSYASAPLKLKPIPMSNVKKADVAAVGKGSYSSATGTKQKGFVEWYEGHLQARPVTTKACTGAVLWGIGDVVAQVVPAFVDESDDNKEFEYDVPRTARAVTFGFAIHAPLSHLHFNFLEWMAVRGGFQGMSIPVFKTIMEQFVYWSWISNSLYHGAMGAMQGMGLDQIYKRIEDVLWDTQVAQWKFWIPVQLLNFQFVPVKHQLNVVLLTSIVWTALLSAWYPPEKKEAEDKTKQESD
eukprot:scaffold5584_cov76-Cyclotella_meneghiniana.AAC.6